MQRRTLLSIAALGVTTGVTGCLSTPTTATIGDDPDATDLLRTVPIHLSVRNRAPDPWTASIALTHVMTPTCRYRTPTCGRPSRLNTAVDTTVDLAPEETVTYEPAVTRIEPGDDYVDTYEFTVSTSDATETLLGLEAGAAATVGRDEAAAYPWRVADNGYALTATITDHGIDLAVGPLD